MDGIHDVGGMDGFGPLEREGSEPDGETFHDEWEGIAYSLFVATLGNGVANIDEFRHSIERMPPKRYLDASYYDRWVTALARLLLEADEIDPEEFATLTEAFDAGEASVPERVEPGLVDELTAGVADAYGPEQPPEEPAFDVGEAVIVRNRHPEGHTRCPRYVRRARGTIVARRGTHVLPDRNAHGHLAAEPLYQVEFDAVELWGEDAPDPRSTVTLDLWESYLASAAEDPTAED